eukprot:2014919-Alexandrium_andersonii.AAC.1
MGWPLDAPDESNTTCLFINTHVFWPADVNLLELPDQAGTNLPSHLPRVSRSRSSANTKLNGG